MKREITNICIQEYNYATYAQYMSLLRALVIALFLPGYVMLE